MRADLKALDFKLSKLVRRLGRAWCSIGEKIIRIGFLKRGS